MSAKHGSKARLWVAQYELSGYNSEVASQMKIDALDVTTQGQTGSPVKSFVPALLEWSKAQKGFWSGEANELDDLLAPLVQTQTQTIFAPAGASEGDIAVAGYDTLVDGYNIASPVGGAIAFDATYKGSHALARGKILRCATVTAAGNGTARSLGASGTLGVEAFLVVTAFAGTDATIKVQTSADGSTGWADRVTFTQVNAATFERATGGTSVEQYHRAVVSGTFTSMTLLVVARNIGIGNFAAG